MRPLSFTLLLFLVSHPNINHQNNDEKTILKLVEDETKAYCNLSLTDVIKKYWILDSQTIKFVSQPDGAHQASSAKDLLSCAATTPQSYAQFQNSGYNLRINGDMAYLTYLQVSDTGDKQKVYSQEMRVLEKINGAWKIHAAFMHILPAQN